MSASATAARWQRPHRAAPRAAHPDSDAEMDVDLDAETDDEALAQALALAPDADESDPDHDPPSAHPTSSSAAPLESEDDLLAEEEALIIADEEARMRHRRRRNHPLTRPVVRQRSHDEDAARNSPSRLGLHPTPPRARRAHSRSSSSSHSDSDDAPAPRDSTHRGGRAHHPHHTSNNRRSRPHTNATLSPNTLRALVLSNSGSMLGNEIFEAQPGFHTDSEPSFTDFFDSGSDDEGGAEEQDGDQTLLPPSVMPVSTSVDPSGEAESDLDALTTDTDDESEGGSDLSALEAALLDIAARASREMELAEKNGAPSDFAPVEAGAVVNTDLALAEEAARQAEMPLLIIEDLDGRLIYARASNGEAVFGSDGEFEYIGEDGSDEASDEDMSSDEELYAGLDFDGNDLDTDDEATLAQHAQRSLLPAPENADDASQAANAEEFAQTQDALRDERQRLLLQRRRSSVMATQLEEPPSDDKYSTWSAGDEAKLLEALTEEPPRLTRSGTASSSTSALQANGTQTLAWPDLNHQTLDLARQLELEMNDDEGETTDEMAEEDMQFSRLLVGSVEPHGHLGRQRRKQQRRERKRRLLRQQRQLNNRRARGVNALLPGSMPMSLPQPPDVLPSATATSMGTASTSISAASDAPVPLAGLPTPVPASEQDAIVGLSRDSILPTSPIPAEVEPHSVPTDSALATTDARTGNLIPPTDLAVPSVAEDGPTDSAPTNLGMGSTVPAPTEPTLQAEMEPSDSGWMADAFAQALAGSPSLSMHATPLRPPLMGSFRPTSSNAKHRAVIDGRREAPSPFAVNSTVRNKGLGIRAAQVSAKRNRARELDTPSQPSKRRRRLSSDPAPGAGTDPRSRSGTIRSNKAPGPDSAASPEAAAGGEEEAETSVGLIDLDLDDVLDASALRMAGSSSPPRGDPLSGAGKLSVTSANSTHLAPPPASSLSHPMGSPSMSKAQTTPHTQPGFNQQAFARWNRVPMNTFRDGQHQSAARAIATPATRYGADALDNLGLTIMAPSPTASAGRGESSHNAQLADTSVNAGDTALPTLPSPGMGTLFPQGPSSDLQSESGSRKVTRREKRARQAQRQAARQKALASLAPTAEDGEGTPSVYLGHSAPVSPTPLGERDTTPSMSQPSSAPKPADPGSEPMAEGSGPRAAGEAAARSGAPSLAVPAGSTQGPPSSTLHGALHSPLFAGLNFPEEELDEGPGGPLMI